MGIKSYRVIVTWSFPADWAGEEEGMLFLSFARMGNPSSRWVTWEGIFVEKPRCLICVCKEKTKE